MQPDECVQKLKDAYSSVKERVRSGRIDEAATRWGEALTSSQYYMLEGRIRRGIHMGDTFTEAVRRLDGSLSCDGYSNLKFNMKLMAMAFAQAVLPDGNG